MTPDDLLTKKDLAEFKKELFDLLQSGKPDAANNPRWLKAKDVQKMFGISAGKVQQLRDTGILPYHKLGNTCFFKPEDIEKAMTKPEKKSN